MALQGSCLCGGIKFEIDGPLVGVGNCHCSVCRKAQSAAFRPRARVLQRDFRWIAGKDLLRSYESSPGYNRGFCGTCGAPIVNWSTPDGEYAKKNPSTKETYGISLGSLDGDHGITPAYHGFVASKAAWYTIADDLPQFDVFPAREFLFAEATASPNPPKPL